MSSNIAIALVGQMRTWEHPKIVQSYQKYILCDEDALIDLYIFSWTLTGYSHRHGRHDIHPESAGAVSEEKIIKYYESHPFIRVIHVCLDDFDEFLSSLDDEMLKIYNTPFNNHGKVSTCVPIEYKYQQAARYLSSIRDIHKYSNLIITRPDASFVDYLPVIETKYDCIYWNNTCIKCIDHGWYGKPSTILRHLYSIFDNLLGNIQLIKESGGYAHLCRDNNELLHLECKKNNIKCTVFTKMLIELIYFNN